MNAISQYYDFSLNCC